MMDAVEPSEFFIVRIHYKPRGLFDIRVFKHFIFCLGILHPSFSGFQVHGVSKNTPRNLLLKFHWADFPSFGGIVDPGLKSLFLFFIADGKPVFDQFDIGTNEHALKFGAAS